jgi:hypothetical protein
LLTVFAFFVLLQKTITMLVLLWAIACCVHGAVVINIVESGGNVVATGSGTINLVGLTFSGSITAASSGIAPSIAAISMAPGQIDDHTGLVGPTSFGNGGVSLGSGSGDAFGVSGSGGQLSVPAGYTSGNQLSGSC